MCDEALGACLRQCLRHRRLPPRRWPHDPRQGRLAQGRPARSAGLLAPDADQRLRLASRPCSARVRTGCTRTHIHVDLAHHNADGTARYCRPKLEMPPPTMPPDMPMVSLPPTGTPAPASMEQRAFTYRFDDNLGTPDATMASPDATLAPPVQEAPSRHGQRPPAAGAGAALLRAVADHGANRPCSAGPMRFEPQ